MLYVGLLTTIIILGVIFKCHTFLNYFSLFHSSLHSHLVRVACSDNGRQCSEGITVRSALIVKNRLETPMELRLDSPSAPDSEFWHCLLVPWADFGWETCLSANMCFCGRARGSFLPSVPGDLLLCLTPYFLRLQGPGPKDWVCFSKLLFTGPM